MNSSKEQNLADKFNAHKPKFISLLGGKVGKVSLNPPSCTYQFLVSKEFCHSVDVVQGGFITAMLDAAMSHAAYAIEHEIIAVSTLEISTRYHAPTHAGKLTVIGQVRSSTYKIAFLEGELRDSDGLLTATSQSTVKLNRKKK